MSQAYTPGIMVFITLVKGPFQINGVITTKGCTHLFSLSNYEGRDVLPGQSVATASFELYCEVFPHSSASPQCTKWGQRCSCGQSPISAQWSLLVPSPEWMVHLEWLPCLEKGSDTFLGSDVRAVFLRQEVTLWSGAQNRQ